MIVIHIMQKNSSFGLSFHTFVCYGVAFFMKLSSHLFYDGYLPLDSTGDWFIKLVEFLSMSLSIGKNKNVKINWFLRNCCINRLKYVKIALMGYRLDELRVFNNTNFYFSVFIPFRFKQGLGI